MNYDVNFFINKFEAIPEEKWIANELKSKDGFCAGGHCGLRSGDDPEENKEAWALATLFSNLRLTYRYTICTYIGKFYKTVAIINDGDTKEYQQPTPKQRILAALYDIKNSTRKDATAEILALPGPIENRIDDEGKKNISVNQPVKVLSD